MLIGIPHYNDIEGLLDCIISLRESSNSKSKIIIMNSDRNLESINPALGDVEIINTPKLGPLDAYNRLFEIAKERKEDLFLAQTDVYFPRCRKDWLDECQEIAKKDNCGMITCWGGGGTSGPDFINGFRWVGAWFVYIPYRTIEKIGGYDMNIPLGYGVDVDYTYAVLDAGLNVYMIDYWVQHMPNYTEGHEHEKVSNIEELKKEAYRYMREKWKVGEYAK